METEGGITNNPPEGGVTDSEHEDLEAPDEDGRGDSISKAGSRN
jgi:hypothetical protein